MATPTLSTVADLKTELGITGSDEDDRLSDILCGAEQSIERYCGRVFASAQRTEYHSGGGDHEVVLLHRPVTAIAGLWVDHYGAFGQNAEAFGSETAWTLGTDYTTHSLLADERNPSLLISLRHYTQPFRSQYGTWPVGVGNIKVTYTAGYSTIPMDLQRAALTLACQLYQQAANGKFAPIQSEQIGRYSYELLGGGQRGSAGDQSITTVRSILSLYCSEVAF